MDYSISTNVARLISFSLHTFRLPKTPSQNSLCGFLVAVHLAALNSCGSNLAHSIACSDLQQHRAKWSDNPDFCSINWYFSSGFLFRLNNTPRPIIFKAKWGHTSTKWDSCVDKNGSWESSDRVKEKLSNSFSPVCLTPPNLVVSQQF